MKELSKYKHIPWTDKPNKLLMPINHFRSDGINEFNEIYQYIKKKFIFVNKTNSGGMPYNYKVKYNSRYILTKSTTRFEIVLVSYLGCFRFQFSANSATHKEDNPVSGIKAVKTIYKKAKDFEIDLSKYACNSPEEGKAIKEEIDRPEIDDYCLRNKDYAEFDNVHHLDLVSSYASRIIEEYPELKPLYEYMYDRRKEYDEYYKHVLTNSIGCMQSPYCPSLDNTSHTSPYLFSKLAKIAVNNTAKLIREYVLKLAMSGRRVLLTNTDGIWYQGDIYHDSREGINLGQWKNDHINCKILIKSKGAYQYIENGVCHTVVRGLTNLDSYKDRSSWEYGDILKDITIKKFSFDEEIGVVENYEKL